MAFVTVDTNLNGIGMWGRTLAEALDQEVLASAERVLTAAKANAPRDTGALAESGYVASWKGNGGARRNARARARRRRSDVTFEAAVKPMKRGQATVVFPVSYAKYQNRRTFFLDKAKRQEEPRFRQAVARRVRNL